MARRSRSVAALEKPSRVNTVGFKRELAALLNSYSLKKKGK